MLKVENLKKFSRGYMVPFREGGGPGAGGGGGRQDPATTPPSNVKLGRR